MRDRSRKLKPRLPETRLANRFSLEQTKGYDYFGPFVIEVGMNLWLDDIRPAPEGWHHVKTVQEAKDALLSGSVVRASLDHDLGACPECLNGWTPEQWLEEHDYKQMPNCEHFGNGYQLVCWMEENGIWPPGGVAVHSANPAGSFKMRQAIDKAYSQSESKV